MAGEGCRRHLQAATPVGMAREDARAPVHNKRPWMAFVTGMRDATARWMLAVATVLLGVVSVAQDYKDAPGPREIEVRQETWHDERRSRDVPVTCYLPVGESQAPAPVILFSHGLGGSRQAGEAWGRHWASHGYACIHLQHAGSDTAVWQGSRSILADMRRAANGANWLLRVQDVSFVLDYLEHLPADDALRKRLDLTRVGMAGHSFGAGTTLGVCGQTTGRKGGGAALTAADPRIKAGIAFSPPVSAGPDLDAAYGGIRVPFMVMTGTEDTSPINDTTPAQREEVYRHLVTPDKYLLVLAHGDHMVFSGQPRRRGAAAHDPENHRLIRMGSIAFWDAYLRQDATAREWLTQHLPEAIRTQGGRCEAK